MPKIDPILRAQGLRLKSFREAAGHKSARAAALEHGWPESTYRAHEAGTRTIGQDDAERYARTFKFRAQIPVSAALILFGPQKPSRDVDGPSGDFAKVPLLSWVTAGKLAEPTSQIPVEDVPLLAFADLGRGNFFALRVLGDSMDRISPDGSIIVVNRADRTLIPGKAYVFAQRGETSYKIWRPDPAHFAPLSTNPTHQPIFIRNKRDVEVIGRVRRTLLDL